MIGDLTNNNDDIDQLGDLVEKELSSMDKAIEEVSLKYCKLVCIDTNYFDILIKFVGADLTSN